MDERIGAQVYFDRADVIMIAIGSDEVLIDINKKGCMVLGRSREEIVGKNWFDNFLPKADRERIRHLFHEMLRGAMRHVHYEHSVVTKDGEKRIFNWHNILASDDEGNSIGMVSSGADVTERREAEKRMKETENRLQLTLDSMLEGCQIIDPDWRYAYINEAVAKQSRRTKEELIGHTMMEIYPGIEKTEMFGHLQECMTKRLPHQMENEFTFPDGSKGWFELRIEPVPEGVLILSWDITERKRLEEELNMYRHRLEDVVAERSAECAQANEKLTQEIEEHKKTEEGLKLRALILDNAREVIFLFNSKGDFAYANDAASETYGYSKDELLNMNLRELFRPQDVPLVDSHLKEVFEKGQLDLETIHVRKDGSLMPVHLRHSLISTSHGKLIVCVLQDVPKESKQQLSLG